MTYERNPPRIGIEKISGRTLAAVALAFVLVLGAIIWGVFSNEITVHNRSPSISTGQGTTAPTAPAPTTAQPPSNR